MRTQVFKWGIVSVSALGIFLMGKFMVPQVLRWAMVWAFALGIFLSLCSALVISRRSGGYISNTLIPELLWLPYGEQYGWPCRFLVPFVLYSSHSGRTIERHEFNVFRLFLNTIFWSIPCFLIFVLMQNGFQDWLLKATWHQWFFVLMLLAPAIYELLHFGLHMISLFHLPFIPLPSLRFIVANWMSNYSVDPALWFTKIVYSTFIGLALTLWLMDFSDRQGILPFHYPLFAVGLLLCVHLAESPLRRAFLQQKLERPRPFTVDSLVIVRRKNDEYPMLEYELTFPQLPQEHVLYEIHCAVYDGERGLNYFLGRPRTATAPYVLMEYYSECHYVKQIDGAIYETVEGTSFQDGQFVQQKALQGTIAIPSTTFPPYLFVSIGFKHAAPNIRTSVDSKYYQWYLVPLTKDMIVDHALFDEGTEEGTSSGSLSL